MDSELIILTYHSVNPDHIFSVKPDEFEKQIKYFAENFDVVSLNNLNLDSNSKKQAVITFDDGYEDNYTYAFQILKKYNVPATIFITSDFIFNNFNITKGWGYYEGLKPLKANEIKEMVDSGFSFGSHSKTHRRLSGLSNDELKIEIVESKKEIENNLGFKISSFSYPFGQKNDFNIDCINILKESGYTTAFSNMWGVDKLDEVDKFSLKRIEINYLDSYKDFLDKIKGKWDFISFFQRIRSFL